MKRYIYTIAVLCTAISLEAGAADEKVQMAKRATYDYEANRGEITLETFLGLGEQTGGGGTSSSADIDVVLVLDYSGSMTDKYSTKSGEPSTYDSYAVTSSYTYDTWKDNLTYNFNGTNYPLKKVSVSGAISSGNTGSWVYFDVGTDRYYVDPFGTFRKAQNQNTPTASSYPRDEYGKLIFPSNKKTDVLVGIPTKSTQSISKRIWALKAGVSSFIDLLYNDSKSSGATHRIAMVEFRQNLLPRFEGNQSDTIKYFNKSERNYMRDLTNTVIGNNDGSATGVIKSFGKIKTEADCISFKAALNYKDPNGITAIDYGIRIGKELLDSYGRSSAMKFVIVFTDGAPTSASGGTTKDPDWTVGTRAVKYALPLKYSGGKLNYPVYTVYCGKDGAATGDQLSFMQALSSNYPQATAYNDLDESKKNPSQIYYFKETAVKGIIKVFEEIASEVIAETKSKYGAETKVVDYIEPTNFKLPKNIVKEDIKVYTKACTGYNSSTKAYSWAEDSTAITTVTVEVDASSSPQSVSVKGFDYAANWCGKQDGTAHGSKLLVKIPFESKSKTTYGVLDTNTGESGAYVKNGTSYVKDEVYNIPSIPFCKLTISRSGLHPGESAIYIITDKDGKFVDKIVLSGDGSETVSRSVYGVPGQKFTVTETEWNWAYNKGTNPITKTVSDFSKPVTFEFSGAHKVPADAEKDKHPTSTSNHDEENKNNPLSLPE